MNQKTTDNLKEESTWLRLVFIILYAILLNITEFVIAVVVVIQFLSKLFTGKVVHKGTVFGQNLSTYMYEIIRFLTFKTDEMPWPINPWPNGPPTNDPKDSEPDGSEKSEETEASDESAEKAEKPAPAKARAKRRIAKTTKTKSEPKSDS